MRNYRVMYTLAVHRFFNYLVRVGDAVSQLLNVTILIGKNPNESISGRSWRLRTKPGWKQLRIAIDWMFSWWASDHCRGAYYADLTRARMLLAEADVKRFDMA